MHPREPASTVHSPEAVADEAADEAGRGWLDRLGVVASVTCAIHCAAMPILLGAIPSLGSSLLGDPLFDWVLFASVLVIGGVSLLPSYLRRHRDARPLRVFGVGVLVLLCARLVAEPESILEAGLAVTGALLVAYGHLCNLRITRACDAGCAHHDHAGHAH